MSERPDQDGIQMKIIWEAGLVQELLDGLNAIVKEAKFRFLDDLIRIWVIDPANVAGCYIDLKPDELDRIQYYSVQEDGLVQGLNTVRLDDLMSYADASVPMQFEFGQKHNWKFNLSTGNVDADLAGIDPESVRQEPDHPGLEDELPAVYSISGSELDDAIRLNDMFSDHTTVAVGDHQVRFTAEGDTDSGEYTLEEGEGELEFHRHPDDEVVKSMFSLDYLDDIRKVLKGNDTVKIYSGHNHPMILDAGLFDYMLAPRLDTS